MKSKTEWKVGLFIAISLVVAVALVLNFAKGISPLTKTYSLNLTTKNVDGIVRNAVVMMAGVPIGNVSKIKLNTDKSEVTITILIEEEFKIREGSKFHIETAGFLGDKYIGIIPTRNQDAPMLTDGATVPCEESFDLMRVARSTSGVVDQLNTATTQITNIIERIDSKLLDEKTLTDLAAGLRNLRDISENASKTIASVDLLITTNTPPIQQAIGNVVDFSKELKTAGGELRSIIDTNRVVVNESMANIKNTTESLNKLIAAAERGEGLAGKLFADEELAQNIVTLSSNLNEVSVKLNRRGLWSVLWEDKTKKKEEAEKARKEKNR
ncbi:MAG: MlaD family protein [Verrucomicrobiales bacterium]|nr:MlaD family protein [Verrucomicrobiales bacterium]